MSDNPRIKLLPSGRLALLLPGPQGDNVEVDLPPGEVEEALIRILAHQQRGTDGVGEKSPATRFWLMHFERHRNKPNEDCLWCQIEKVAPHPITKLPMGQSAFGVERKVSSTNKTVEELGL